MTMWTVSVSVALATSTFGLRPSAVAAQTGTITGRITFEAAPPARRTANRYTGGGAATAHAIQALPPVVYVMGRVDGGATPTSGAAVMAQRDTAFAPNVVPVAVGGSVAFPNGDPFFHNVFSYSSAQRFDLGRYPQGESKSVSFPQPGVVEVFCEVHEFMRGAVLVTENPFHAVAGADGAFRISGVPPGEYTLAIWHPDHDPVERRAVVTAGGTASVEVELRR